MELSSSQIEEFEERGFLFFPELLKSHEVKLLTDHLEGLYSRTGPEVVREKKGDGIRDLVRSRGLGDVYKRQAMKSNF